MSLRIPLAGLVVAVLLTVAFVFLLYRPRSAEQAVLQAATAQLQSQQASLRAEIARLEQVRADEPRIREILGRLNALIPSEVAQPQVLEELQTLSDVADVDLTSVTFSAPVPMVPLVEAPDGRALAVITTTMGVEGGYYAVVDFLSRVEHDGPRAVLVDSVALAEGESRFPSLAATVNARLFAFVEPVLEAVPGAGATPAATPAQAPPTAQPSATAVPAPLPTAGDAP